MEKYKIITREDLDKVSDECSHNQIWLDVDHFGYLWCVGCKKIGQITGFADGKPVIRWLHSYHLPGLTWAKTGNVPVQG